jgi:hypothetical protein
MRRDGDVVGRKDAVAGMNEECGRRGGRGIRNGGAVKGKGGAKKRPSVETEGRLTIACHMKILQKIDVDGAGFLCLFTIPFFTGDTKIMTRTYPENISMIPNG